MKEIKFRLRFHEIIVGFEKWYGGVTKDGMPLASPRWLYSRDGGQTWSPEYIENRSKDEYTGLKDKNGQREIYEGDILRRKNTDGGIEIIEVKYVAPRFNIGDYNPTYGYEVIGNVHENPELLV